jgi:hypothetical protein
MKKSVPFLVLLVLPAIGFAADTARKSTSPAANAEATGSIPATAAKVTKPLAVKEGILVLTLPSRTDLPDGGEAVFEFSVPKDGDYVVYGVVNAPDDENNSFYVNIDTRPKEDPLMIWDIDHTNGFEERVVNWRGSGEAGSDEFNPKVFKLTAGAHKLYLVGREPAQLKSVSIRPAKT